MGKFRTFVLSISFFTYLLLEGRLFIQLNTHGRGLLPYLNLALPLVVAAVAFLPPRHNLGFLRRRFFWLSCGIYALLAVLYPILGIVSGEYAPRHLLSTLEGIRPVTFVALGYLLAADGPVRARSLLQSCIVGALLIQVAYASLQFLSAVGYYRSPLLTSLASWDRFSQLAYNGNYIAGRSTGLYLNPNELGFWAVTAFWAGILLFSGRTRVIAVIGALITLVLSQSRGSLVALAGSAAIYLFYEVARLAMTGRSSRKRLRGAVAPALCVLASSLLLLTLLDSAWSSWPILTVMHERLQVVPDVLAGSISRDANFAARVDVWAMVPRFMVEYPLGTFGPPQVLFGEAIDNDYIRVLLQGGLVYLFAVAGALFYMISLIRYRQPEAQFVGIATSTIAINAITALPLTYSSVALVWVLLGYLTCAGLRGDDTAGHQPRSAANHRIGARLRILPAHARAV